MLTLEPRSYEGRLDESLGRLVPPTLPVVRCSAWSPRWTRKFGIGDLGLRAFRNLKRAAEQVLAAEKFDALFITLYPSYPALLGPILKRKFGVPFVLDYQDPWVGAWGRMVGGGSNGQVDFKSRLTRWLATKLEPPTVRAADAITAVSAGTYEEVFLRNPDIPRPLCASIPLGGEAADFEYLRQHPRPNPFFNPSDGCFHLCYVGTLLPLGFKTLRAVLLAVQRLQSRQQELFGRLRVHFFGTSNQTAADSSARVLPMAKELSIAAIITEHPARVDYLDALTLQIQASAILILGSSERHYTASKLFPGLLAARPILAVYHEHSSVVTIMRKAVRPPNAHLVSYNDQHRAESCKDEIHAALVALLESPDYRPSEVSWGAVKEFAAESLAGQLAEVLNAVAGSGNRLNPSSLVEG